MKELAIGDTVKCVEGFNCGKCIFGDRKLLNIPCSKFCGGDVREDGKNVHFEIVPAENKESVIDTMIKRACDWLCGNCEMCGDCEWQHSNTDCPTLKSMKIFMND